MKHFATLISLMLSLTYYCQGQTPTVSNLDIQNSDQEQRLKMTGKDYSHWAIGSSEGFDSRGIIIAGLNYYNSSNYSTKRIYMGSSGNYYKLSDNTLVLSGNTTGSTHYKDRDKTFGLKVISNGKDWQGGALIEAASTNGRGSTALLVRSKMSSNGSGYGIRIDIENPEDDGLNEIDAYPNWAWALLTHRDIAYRKMVSNSDRRIKENITDVDGGLDNIMKLKPKRYDLIGTGRSLDGEGKSFGLIAQEVQEVFPSMVTEVPQNDSVTILGIEYNALIPHLISAIQELKATVDAQEDILMSIIDKEESNPEISILNLSPNPVSRDISVTLYKAAIGSEIKIISNTGTLVETVLSTEDTTVIDVSSLPSGIYHVIVNDDVERIMVQR